FAFQGAAGGQDLLGQIWWGVGKGMRCRRWCHDRSRGRSRVPNPDQHGLALIDGHALALKEFDLQILQRLIIELELPRERAIGDTAALAQQRDHLIHHDDKVHPALSLPGAWPPYVCATPS